MIQNEGAAADAVMAAMLLAVDPCVVGGVRLRERASALRDAWLGLCRDLIASHGPVKRCPIACNDDRLLGGLDLAATLSAGRPIAERGLLADCNGGVLILPSAERLTPEHFARMSQAFDRRAITLERDGLRDYVETSFGMIALDEGIGNDETPPVALCDRLGIWITLDTIRSSDLCVSDEARHRLSNARSRRARVVLPSEMIEVICRSAMALGVVSIRAVQFSAEVARSSAALSGREEVNAADVTWAARLVLAPRATQMPIEQAAPDDPDDAPGPQPVEPQNEETQPDPSDADQNRPATLDDMTELVLAAAAAAVPEGLLSRLKVDAAGPRPRSTGRSGATCTSSARGRPAGARPGVMRDRRHLALVDTLRAAAPWQRVRAALETHDGGSHPRLRVRRDDFRIRTFKHRSETATIFVVDASGSNALHRLAEVKGAVELILTDCYARRDSVALIAFRGTAANVLLAPTRSLSRARKHLIELPGGGGTPLALALAAARDMALSVIRKGQTPSVVLMTDGRANIDRDGRPGREAAMRDAIAEASTIRESGLQSILIDCSPRRSVEAERVANEMGATYVPLPFAEAATLSRTVRAATSGTANRTP